MNQFIPSLQSRGNTESSASVGHASAIRDTSQPPGDFVAILASRQHRDGQYDARLLTDTEGSATHTGSLEAGEDGAGSIQADGQGAATLSDGSAPVPQSGHGTAPAAGAAGRKDAGGRDPDEQLDDASLAALALDIAAAAAAIRQTMMGAGQASPAGSAASSPDAQTAQHAARSGAAPSMAGAADHGAADVRASVVTAGLQASPILPSPGAHPGSMINTLPKPPDQRINTLVQARRSATGLRASLSGGPTEPSGALKAVLARQARLEGAAPAHGELPFGAFGNALSNTGQGTSLRQRSGIAAPDSEAMPAVPLAGLQAAGFSLASPALPPGAEPSLYGASGQITAPLNSPQWQAELGRQLIILARGVGQQPHTAELRLDPPELGPLRITLTISDHVASASFVSTHANVRSVVEQALPALQQSLSQAGLSLGHADVGGQAHAGREFGQAARDASAGQGGDQRLTVDADAMAAREQPASAPARHALIDTFV